jgi:hypothetical protein
MVCPFFTLSRNPPHSRPSAASTAHGPRCIFFLALCIFFLGFGKGRNSLTLGPLLPVLFGSENHLTNELGICSALGHLLPVLGESLFGHVCLFPARKSSEPVSLSTLHHWYSSWSSVRPFWPGFVLMSNNNSPHPEVSSWQVMQRRRCIHNTDSRTAPREDVPSGVQPPLSCTPVPRPLVLHPCVSLGDAIVKPSIIIWVRAIVEEVVPLPKILTAANLDRHLYLKTIALDVRNTSWSTSSTTSI